MKKRLLSLLVCLGLMAGCSAAEPQEALSEPQPEKKIQIGLSFDSFVIERWQRDRDAFVARAR